MSPLWLLPAAAPYADMVSVGTTVVHLDRVPNPGLSLGATHHRGLVASVHAWPTGDVAGLAGASWMVLDREKVRLGPTLSLGGSIGPAPLDDRGTVRAGAAWSVGSTWNWQGSATVFGASLWRVGGLQRHSLGETILALETTVSRRWGPNAASLGFFGPFPTLGYARELEHLTVDARFGGGSGALLGMARVSWALPGGRQVDATTPDSSSSI